MHPEAGREAEVEPWEEDDGSCRGGMKGAKSGRRAKRGQEWFSKAQHFSSLFSSHFHHLPHFFQQTVSRGLSPAGVGMIRPSTIAHANAASTIESG